jgi:hypothetical protein
MPQASLSEQIVPTLSEQMAMPVTREHVRPATPPPGGDSLESKITLEGDRVGRPPADSDSMELGPPGAGRPTLVGTPVPTPIPHVASGPIRAPAKPAAPLKPSAGSSGQLRIAEVIAAPAEPPARPTPQPRATTGPPTINLPSPGDDAIHAAIGEALDAASDDPVQSGDNFIIRIKNKGAPGSTGEQASLVSGTNRALTSSGGGDRPSSPLLERAHRRAESPRELIKPKATSTVIAKQRSSVLPVVITVVVVLALAAAVYFFT